MRRGEGLLTLATMIDDVLEQPLYSRTRDLLVLVQVLWKRTDAMIGALAHDTCNLLADAVLSLWV
jgi:hypothetical protein